MQTEIKAAVRQAVDEYKAAEALGISVHTLRQDRVHDRRIPFFRIGRSVRYDLDRVWQALAALEVGGPVARPERRTA